MLAKLAISVFLFMAVGGIFLLSTGPTSAQCVVNSTTYSRAVNGLISNQPQAGTQNLFGNNIGGSGICVNNLQAAIPTFQIPTFAELKSQFYDQFYPVTGVTQNQPVASATETKINNWLGTNSYTTNYVTGNVTVGGINSNDSGVAVVFVGGKMAINGNIIHPNGGLVFVVAGNISIDKSVTQIDAVLVSTGVICTANDTNAAPQCSSTSYTDPATTAQLVINGSLIALNQGSPIVFRRQLVDNRTPAEVVNQQPKYMVLLKNLFSQTLTITTIGTDFAGKISTNGPLLQVSCSASPNPQFTNQPVQWSATPSGGSGGYTFQWSSSDASVNGQTQQSFSTSYSSPGTINASVVVTDSSNNRNSGSCALTVKTSIPTLSVNPNPACGANANPSCSTTPSVSWSSVPSPTSSDLLALYSAGAPSGAWIADLAVTDPKCSGGGGANGSCTFAIPSFIPSGPYELRYVNSSFATIVSTPLTVNN